VRKSRFNLGEVCCNETGAVVATGYNKKQTKIKVMKSTKLTKILVATVLLSGLTPAALALTATETSSILFMKQEEKLARDVYQVLHAKWGHVTFGNIAISEQRHMDAVDGLIARYRLTDTTPKEAGKFTYPELQALYDELIALGSKSLADGLAVGVLIEETDIADLKEALKATREKPIRNVFSNLMDGSYNHLAAFTRALN